MIQALYALYKLKKTKKNNHTICLCKDKETQQAVFISIQLAQLSPFLQNIINNGIQEDGEIVDFTAIFSAFNTIFKEVNYVVELLAKLQKKYQNDNKLYFQLTSECSHINQQFCWDNITLLRHELYIFCNTYAITKQEALENLKVICKLLQLKSLHYFSDVFVPNVTKKQLILKIPRDIKNYIGSYLLSDEKSSSL